MHKVLLCIMTRDIYTCAFQIIAPILRIIHAKTILSCCFHKYARLNSFLFSLRLNALVVIEQRNNFNCLLCLCSISVILFTINCLSR